MTIDAQQIQALSGKVYDRDGDKVGGIGQVYLDDVSGEPTWVTVKTGLFGSAETFVPLQSARITGDDLRVDVDQEKIKDAPRVDADGSISPEEERRLYAYYDLSDGDPVPTDADEHHRSDATRTDSAGTVGTDTSGPTTDEAMTRSEERLQVGTATREAGRARLRKYVTSQNVTETVPVRHEEVTLEREPITDANYAASQSGPAISEEEHEVVLHEEVPTVDKDVVAVERVWLGKETVTEDVTVSEDVRQENVELVDPDARDRR